jgi:HD-GYP domain-containing protein (c-di-GMP phosphodiesterase class II)
MTASITLPRARIVWTILGALMFVGLVPLVVSHYFLTGINRDALETLEKKYLTRSAVTISNEIDNSIRNNLEQIQNIAGGLRSTTSLLARGQDPFTFAAREGIIRNFISPESDLIALWMVNREGQGATAQPEQLGEEARLELSRGFERTLQGEDYIGRFLWLDFINQPAVVVATPVAEGDRILGGVIGLVSLREIQATLREESSVDVSAFVVDREGRVLMHSLSAVAVQQPDYSDVTIVQEFMKAPVRLTQSYERTLGGLPVEMLGTVAPVSSVGWGVVVERETEKAFASVASMKRATRQWIGVAVILAVLTAAIFAGRLSKPIRSLAASSREIAAGNYEQRVQIDRRDEIGELAENFNLMSGEIQKAIDGLKAAAQENHLLFVNSVRMLAAAIDAKDPYTRGHSERVAKYSLAIGRQLGLSQRELVNIRVGALLHDVGKIGIDDRILRKPGALTEEEFEVMKTHPVKGEAIMGGVPQLREMLPGMLYHHERWEGGGYPEGLAGEAIPMLARIISLSDTFDAMTTNRPYQKAMEIGYVIQRIQSFANTRFDPRVVNAFMKALDTGEIQPEGLRGAA